MSNEGEYYAPSGSPATSSFGSSEAIRAEFISIKDGFNKLPSLEDAALKMVSVNASETGLEAVEASTVLSRLGISASYVSFTPAGNISSSDLQNALEELDSEKVASSALDAAISANGDVVANTAKGDFDSTTASRLLNTSGTNTGDQDAEDVPFTPYGSITSTDVQAAVEELEDSKASIVSASVTYTIGSGGDYTTLNDALEDLSKRSAVYVSGGISVILNLLSGFVLSEQVDVNGVDLSWVKITSVGDAVISISGSSIGDSNAVFEVTRGKLPVFALQFTDDGTSTDSIFCKINEGGEVFIEGDNGFIGDTFGYAFRVLQGGSLVSSGSIRASDCGVGIYSEGGKIVAASAIYVDDNSTGIRLGEGAEVSANLVSASDCLGTGVYMTGKSSFSSYTFGATNCASNGVYLDDGSSFSISAFIGNSISATSGEGVDARGGSRAFLTGSISGSSNDISALEGSIVSATGASFSTSNIAVNTLTSDGIIFG